MKSKEPFNTATLTRAFFTPLLAATLAAAIWALPGTAHGQIFIANSGSSTGTVGVYHLSGTTVNTSLVTGLNSPQGVAVSGTNLFVVNTGNGTIGKYNLDGTTVNASLVTGLSDPTGIAVSGTNLFVSNNNYGTIGEYTTTGATVNTAVISGLAGLISMAVSGTDLFVADGTNNGRIGKYTTSGSTVNASLITNYLDTPFGIAVSGTNLFVVKSLTATIGEYTTDGATVNDTLVSGLNGPQGIAVSGTTLFITEINGGGTNGRIGKYTTSGARVNASLVTGLNSPRGIVVLPEPTTTLIAAKGDKIEYSELRVAGPPAINAAGDVAFRAGVRDVFLESKTSATYILLYSGTNIARFGGGDPNGGATFTKLSDPVLSSGALAFVGTLKIGDETSAGKKITAANNTGIWVVNGSTGIWIDNSINLLVRKGDPAPILDFLFHPTTFTGFTNIGITNAGGVALLATVSSAAKSPALYAIDQFGYVQHMTYRGDVSIRPDTDFADFTITSITAFGPLAEVGGQSRTLDVQNGNVAALVKGAGGNAAVALGRSGTGGFVSFDVVNSTNFPQEGHNFKSFNEPIVNANGTVAYLLTLTGSGVNATNNTAIELSGSGGNTFVRTGDSAPDASGSPGAAHFSKLSNPVLNNNDRIAFIGTLKTGGTSGVITADDTGIWSNADGTMRQIVREKDPAPDGGIFSRFYQIVLPDVGGPIFLAGLSGVPAASNQGVFALMKNGTLVRVVRKGDSLDFRNNTKKTVKKIGIFQQAALVLSQSRSFDASTANLVYQATFTDGTWGIYEATFQ